LRIGDWEWMGRIVARNRFMSGSGSIASLSGRRSWREVDIHV
jgi:hypothetical protein